MTGRFTGTSGKIILNNQETAGKTIMQIRQMGMAHISEDRIKFEIANNLSIQDNIAAIINTDIGLFVEQKVPGNPFFK